VFESGDYGWGRVARNRGESLPLSWDARGLSARQRSS
jgi:hypothetical protein